MAKDKIFIFDMDGVIVDSVGSLLSMYGDFLKRFGKQHQEHELTKINGMKIREIATFMKQNHNLKEDVEFLIKEYDEEMKRIYTKVLPMKGIKQAIELLAKNYLLCVASSSKKENIEFMLNKFGLKQYFEYIVSGDDITNAKPSPEIYKKIIKKYGEKEYYVIEDSSNGLTAAKLAGAKTIFYNPKGKKLDQKVDFNLASLEEIKKLLIEINVGIKVLDKIDNIEFVQKDFNLYTDNEKQEKIHKIWQEQSKLKPTLFNGKISSYISHKSESGKIIVNYFVTDYKTYLAKLLGNIDLEIYPLAVNGITIVDENRFIVAKRRGVSEYEGYWEFVPSGGITFENIKKEFPHKQQINEELYEELGEKVNLDKIKLFYLFFDKCHRLYSVGCQINVDSNFNLENFKKGEYSEYKVFDKNEVRDFINNNNFVPISKAIFELLE